MYMHTYMHTCVIHTYICTCIHAYIHLQTYVYNIHTYMQSCMHIIIYIQLQYVAIASSYISRINLLIDMYMYCEVTKLRIPESIQLLLQKSCLYHPVCETIPRCTHLLHLYRHNCRHIVLIACVIIFPREMGSL